MSAGKTYLWDENRRMLEGRRREKCMHSPERHLYSNILKVVCVSRDTEILLILKITFMAKITFK